MWQVLRQAHLCCSQGRPYMPSLTVAALLHIVAGWMLRTTCLSLCVSTRPGDRHTSLALYILLRGITLLIRCGNKPDAPPTVRKVLAPTRWKHGDTALMCLATSQITYSWIMMPHTLPKSYVKFLNKHGGRQQWHYDAAKVVPLYIHMSCQCL